MAQEVDTKQKIECGVPKRGDVRSAIWEKMKAYLKCFCIYRLKCSKTISELDWIGISERSFAIEHHSAVLIIGNRRQKVYETNSLTDCRRGSKQCKMP